MRVLYLAHSFLEPYFRLITSVASRHGYDVTVMCDPRSGHISELVAQGISVEACDCRRKIDLRLIRRLRQRLRTEKFDVVDAISPRMLSNVLIAATGTHQPSIIGNRGIISTPKWLDPANWITVYHPRLDGMTCVSQAAADGLLAGGCKAQLKVNYLAQEAQWIVQRKPGRTRLEFGIPADAFVVGCVANARRVKGIDVLLEAVNKLSHLSNLHVLVVGDMSRVPQLADIPNDNIRSRVHFSGYRADGPRLTSDCDIYVQPSRQEGLGLSVLEAMSCGICPIVSNVGGLAEIVRHNIDGLVVEPENPNELAARIEELFNNPESRLSFGIAAKERISEAFQLKKMMMSDV